jgi:hypothetical protein
MAYNFISSEAHYMSSSGPTISTFPTTFSIWVYANSDDVGMTPLAFSSTNNVNLSRLVLVGQISGDPVRAAQSESAGGSNSSIGDNGNPPGFVINTWHHVCGVFTSSTLRLVYRDGVAGTPNTVLRNPIDLSIVTIGSLFGFQTFFNGYISDVAMWSEALTQEDVTSLSKGFSAKRIRPQHLKYYAPLIRNVYEYNNNISLTVHDSQTNTKLLPISHNRIYL